MRKHRALRCLAGGCDLRAKQESVLARCTLKGSVKSGTQGALFCESCAPCESCCVRGTGKGVRLLLGLLLQAIAVAGICTKTPLNKETAYR